MKAFKFKPVFLLLALIALFGVVRAEDEEETSPATTEAETT